MQQNLTFSPESMLRTEVCDVVQDSAVLTVNELCIEVAATVLRKFPMVTMWTVKRRKSCCQAGLLRLRLLSYY